MTGLTKITVFSLFIIFHIGCAESEEEKPRIKDFQSTKLFDENGSPLGCHPLPCDDDWTWQTLEDHELILLYFGDTTNITLLADTGRVLRVEPYPIPLSRNGGMSFFIEGDENLLVKMIMVNSNYEVLSQWSTKTSKPFTNIFLSKEHFDLVPDSTRVRIYYRVFNRLGGTDQTGFGDITICPEGKGANYIEDCF